MVGIVVTNTLITDVQLMIECTTKDVRKMEDTSDQVGIVEQILQHWKLLEVD